MRNSLYIAMAIAGLLTACDGNNPSDTTVVNPPNTAARVTLNGVAAKGLMAGADVTVLAVNAADGTVSSTVLGTTTTSPTGTYSVTFDGTAGVPYVIRISAKADGTTTHLDEIKGSQPLPAGFTLRALGVPASGGAATVSTTVTPFSEMVAAAATRATGGITAANTAQAVSTVSQLLGFNPLSAAAPSTAAGASTSAQQLALMLTAVSKLAADGGLGCSTGTAGDKTRCVTEALAAAASTGSIKLQNGGTDVSAALARAVSTVLADPALAGAVPPSSLTVVLANLACTGSACTAAPATGGTPPGPTATAQAIAASKQLFTEIRSDFASMFSRGGISATSGGAANAEAWKFNAAMQGMQVPVDVMAKDLGVLLTAADLYNDFMARRTTLNVRGGAPDLSDGNVPFNHAIGDAVACGLYADTTNTVLATTPAQVVQIGCRALFYVSFNPVTRVRREWRHGFTITPGANGSFAYTTRARLRTTPCVAPACTDFNVALQPDFYSGTLSTTLNANGSITGFSVNGRLPGAFVTGQTGIYNAYHEWQMQGTRTITGVHQEVAAISGTLTAYATGGALQGTLTLRQGSNLVSMPVTRSGDLPGTGAPATQGTVSGGTLHLAWSTSAAEFDGLLSMTDSVWDSSGTAFSPQRAELTGSLRNVTGGVASEFLRGSFVATVSGFTSHNAALPLSPVNRFNQSFSFVAAVAAPSRPRLEITLGGAKTSEQPDLNSLTLQYRSVVNGAPRIVVGVTATRGASGVNTYSLTEASANLRMDWRENAATVDLFQGTTLLGTLNTANGMLTFVDGSFISLDAGL